MGLIQLAKGVRENNWSPLKKREFFFQAAFELKMLFPASPAGWPTLQILELQACTIMWVHVFKYGINLIIASTPLETLIQVLGLQRHPSTSALISQATPTESFLLFLSHFYQSLNFEILKGLSWALFSCLFTFILMVISSKHTALNPM